MTEGDKNIKLYSVTDIQKYLDGKLSVTEMHDFEKAAMEDPLLADALEGVQNLVHPNESFETGMDDLTVRLQQRVAEEDKNEMVAVPTNRLWWRAAAALIILLAVSALTFTYLVNRKSPAEDIATLKRSVIPDSKQAIRQPTRDSNASAAIVPNSQLADSATTLTSPSAMQHKVSTQKNSPAKSKEPVDKSVNSEIEKNTVRELKSDTLPFASAPDLTKNIVPPEKVIEGKVAGVQSLSRASSAGVIQGRVVDANLKPVPGAVVLNKNAYKIVSTDKNGEFKLPIVNDSNARVRVSAVGFQPLTTTLNRFDDNLVQLQTQSSSLNEVVVSGSGNRRKQEFTDADSAIVQNGYAGTEKITVLKAMPVTGWQDFKNYLTRNKKILTADSTTTGSETLSFTVDKHGRRSSFQIDNSLSPAHDAESIRLIKEGPAWKLLKGKKARVTVNIEF